ncbi:MAG TPA: fatty acid CoA ligase family protein [Urbifossiella sp.]|nr:fatty acid CoA ligase family protein [Urbifossiella sp.]
MVSVNVAEHLVRMAAAEPDRPAIHFPAGSLTFAQLNAESDAIARGLLTLGITRGMRTALMVPPSPDFFATTFALFKLGAVPVFIDPGMGIKNLGKCLGEAAPEAFIGIPKAHMARRLFGWARRSIRITVNAGRGRFYCDASLNRLRNTPGQQDAGPAVQPDGMAAILFTSGSTGVAKGVVYTHGIFAAQIELLKSTYGIAPGEIDYCTFPLFALFAPALGMTCVIPDMDARRPARIDPHKAAAQIRRFGVTNLFGSPAVIRRLGELAESPPTAVGVLGFTTLRRVISAGAPASARDLERFMPLLPDRVQVFTPYGATEALPVANIGSREVLGETRRFTEQGKGVCIGRHVSGVIVQIIPIRDEAIPEWDESLELARGEIGEFAVRGPIVTKEYFRRPEATKLAKMLDPRTGEMLHRMGDVGYRDEQGRLWFCGRKSHRVNAPWGTLFTDQVEPVFNAVSGVFRSALVGVARYGATHPVLCIEALPTRPWEELLRDLHVAASQYEHTRRIATFLNYRGGFPVDVRHNSKIFREKLAAWADRTLGKAWRPQDNKRI